MGIMTYVWTRLYQVLGDRRGVSATEYTLMVVGIAALVMLGATSMGSGFSSALSNIGAYVSGQGSSI